MEFTLLFAAGTAFVFIWVANRTLRKGYPDWLEKPTDLLIGAAAVGMLVGRLAAMVMAGVNPITNPFDIILVRGGVDTAFATLGALAALAWASRDHLPAVLDLLAPAALAGLAGWHTGCLWRGSCLGAASDLPWAMALEGSTVTRHPVELYAALGLVLAAWAVRRVPPIAWVPSGAALTAAAAIRLATEPLRLSVIGGSATTYALGVVLGLSLIGYGITRRIRAAVTA